MLVGYPLWWVLGIAQILSLAAAGVMLLDLLRRRRVTAPRGFLLWLLFLAWVLIGVVVLQVNAPGTVHGTSNTRYLTFCFRFAWYTAATVVLLYLGNMRKEISNERITRAFGAMFVTIVAGGVLGTVVPQLDFPSLIEFAIPHSITSIPFVRDFVHPVVAQLNVVQGVVNPRASAPFAYTNGWALNFAVMLPFFLMAWFGPNAGWRRKAGPVVLAVALIPVIVSVNRGLWIALTVTAIFISVRSAVSGRPKSLAAMLAGAGLVIIVILTTPLGTTVQNRFDNGYSDDSRANLSTTSVETVARISPVVGLGTTRDLQGSFTSIAGGATAACPMCAPPALGTQGHLWGLIFATGVGGLALYLGFFAVQFMRGLRQKSPYATLGLAVIVAHFSTMPFYDIMGIAMFAISAGVALIWRARDDLAEPTLSGYASAGRAHARLILACAVIGLLVAGGTQLARGPQYTGDVSILLPTETTYPNGNRQPTSLDTLAQIVNSSAVLDAIEEETGLAVGNGSVVEVSASPNTRILHITVRSSVPSVAGEGATAAATALLRARQADLLLRRRGMLDELNARAGGLAEAVTTVSGVIDNAPPRPNDILGPVRFELVTQLNKVTSEVARVAYSPLEPGSILAPPRVRPVTDGWNVALASGLMLGLLAGVALSLMSRRARIPSIGRVGRESPRDPATARTDTYAEEPQRGCHIREEGTDGWSAHRRRPHASGR